MYLALCNEKDVKLQVLDRLKTSFFDNPMLNTEAIFSVYISVVRTSQNARAWLYFNNLLKYRAPLR